jgi:Asp-tRNA(Asn)/Glu-tRNA(Gln) amidotransferase A subunit family amidase
VPFGVKDLEDLAGLPVGLQMVAERGREDLLLQVARAWERVRPFDEWPVEPRPGA